MTAATSNAATATSSASDPHTHVTCIDLPGEAVQCWRSSVSKIKVILRKHRDVIFNVQLFKGMIYTVHAEQSEFYDARAKKIVFRGGMVTFHDGELMHLWVSREFKGALVLKANGRVMGRYEPNRLDPARHDNEPATKPAPLIISMKNEPQTAKLQSQPAAPTVAMGTPNDPLGTGKPSTGLSFDEEVRLLQMGGSIMPAASQAPTEQVMHVVEVNPDSPDLPTDVAEFFKRGGEQTAIDTDGLITRNWLWGQISGAAAYYSDNQHWIKELWQETFYLQKIVHRTAGTKWYVVFRGNQRLRQFLNGTRYGVMHPKVLAITAGAGSVQGLRHAAWDAAKGSLKKAGLLAIVFTITLDTAEWLGDYEQRDPYTGKPKRDFFDLVYKIGIDFAKAGISSVLGAVAMAGLVFLGIASGGAAVVVGVVILSVVIGLGIDWLDKRTSATDSLNKVLRESAAYLEKKLPSDYGKYESTLEQALVYGGWGHDY